MLPDRSPADTHGYIRLQHAIACHDEALAYVAVDGHRCMALTLGQEEVSLAEPIQPDPTRVRESTVATMFAPLTKQRLSYSSTAMPETRAESTTTPSLNTCGGVVQSLGGGMFRAREPEPTQLVAAWCEVGV
jgi:hypothetical protein